MWFATLAFLPAACTTEHLTIGAVNGQGDASSAVADLDAATAPTLDGAQAEAATQVGSTDGGLGSSTSMLSVSLLLFGRDDVTQAIASCGRPCVAAEFRVTGGTPPYTVSWGDGTRGTTDSLCLDPQGGPASATWAAEVQDAKGRVIFKTFPYVLRPYIGIVDCFDAEVPKWTVDLQVTPANLDCPDAPGLWYQLDQPLQEGQISVGAGFPNATASSSRLQLSTATAPCGELEVMDVKDVSMASPSLSSGTFSGIDAPPRYVVVTALDEPDGKPTADFQPGPVQVSFTR